MKRFFAFFCLVVSLGYSSVFSLIEKNDIASQYAVENSLTQDDYGREQKHLNALFRCATQSNDSHLAKALYSATGTFFEESLYPLITNGTKEWDWALQILFSNIEKNGHFKEKKKTIAFCDYLYREKKKLKKKKKPIIPKIIHQIWIGPLPLPQKFARFAKEWESKHPDWKYRLWTNKDLERFNLKNKTQFKRSKNWGQKSDIWRYEILERFGGVYLDIDFVYVRPLDSLHKKYDFFCARIDQFHSIANGVIGAVPHHPILKKCVEQLGHKKISRMNDPQVIMRQTGPYFFGDQVLNHLVREYKNHRSVVLPFDTFFSFPRELRGEYKQGRILDEGILKFATKDSVAVHLWGTTWVK